MTYTRFSGFGHRPVLASLWRAAWLLVALCLLLGALSTSARAAPLELRDDLQSIEAWPALTVLPDPSGTLLVNDVLAELTRFQHPPCTSGTLGGGTPVGSHTACRPHHIQWPVGVGHRLPRAAAH